ncbi:MAG: polyphenol oxidase family protein [Candidatus Methylomirabilia bacterium]
MSSSLVRLHGDPPTHLTFVALEALGVPHLSTTRHCPGIVHAGRRAAPIGLEAGDLLRRHGLEVRRLAFLDQVHGAAVIRADGSKRGAAGRGDVLLTSTPGIPLAVFAADCLALILYDPVRALLAVVHAGWRGTIAGAARAAVDALAAAGSSLPDLLAAIAPSIGPCCYEVDRPVIEPLGEAFPHAWEGWARAVSPGKWMLDLWQANEFQLAAAGVSPERILNPRLCTSCRRDLFCSYRKEGSSGRLLTLASIPVGRRSAS